MYKSLCWIWLYISNGGRRKISFVPQHTPIVEADVIKLKEFVKSSGNLLVITGAGISTESGIPDYRSRNIGLYATSSKRPITYQEFLKNSVSRKNYWLRNFIGWPKFSSLEPNRTHFVINTMEKRQLISHVVTQNVDNLHFKAGTQNVIELHGSTYRVNCINCNYSVHRHSFQKLLQQLNPGMSITSDVIRPDGDVEVSKTPVSTFVLPDCPACKGLLKPDVVFFGDNVPKERVKRVKDEVQNCDSVLVLGSSLSVFSAFRIILQASQLKKPVAIVSIGKTRADDLAKLKIETKCGDILPLIF